MALPTPKDKTQPPANISARNGRASVKIQRIEDGRIEATASCDSLARLVITLREELETARSNLQEQYYKPPDKGVSFVGRLKEYAIWVALLSGLIIVLQTFVKWYKGKNR